VSINPTTVTYRASLSLEDLAKLANTDEGAIGPLSAMGHTATSSAMTFVHDEPVPDTPFVLVEESEPAPVGKTKICDGYVWNAGKPAHVSAYR
jgi:hypothetical protein